MLSSFVGLIQIVLLALLRTFFVSLRSTEAENLFLRYQLQIAKRELKKKRVQFQPWDRIGLAALGKNLSLLNPLVLSCGPRPFCPGTGNW